MTDYVYMMVTRDEYELPLCVCDTASELASKVGTTVDAIKSAIYHQKKRGGRSIYKKVMINFEDEE